MDNTYTPQIIFESNTGLQALRIQDKLFAQRKILCVGEITAEAVNELIIQLQYLAQKDSESEITIYINSPGGEVTSGLALYDVMNAIECPIRTVCVGIAASMGAVLFAAGDVREMLPHARVMIHDPLVSSVGGSALKLKGISDDLLRTRDVLCEILSQHTGRDINEIYYKTASDTYFYADEAIEFGLADKIIDKIN